MQTRNRKRNRANPRITWHLPNERGRGDPIMYPAHISDRRKLELVAAGPRFGFMGAIASVRRRNEFFVFNRRGYLIANLVGVSLETAKRYFSRYYKTHPVC